MKKRKEKLPVIHTLEVYNFENLSNQNYIGYGSEDAFGVVKYGINRKNECFTTELVREKADGSRVTSFAFGKKIAEKDPLFYAFSTSQEQIYLKSLSHKRETLILNGMNDDEEEEEVSIFIGKKETGHSEYINCLDIFQKNEKETLLVSGSDDQTLRLWSEVERKKSKLLKEYPCAITSFSKESKTRNESNLLLLSLQNGFFQILDGRQGFSDVLRGQTLIGGAHGIPVYPFLDIDWNPFNSNMIGGVSGAEFFFWDLRNVKQAVFHQLCHLDGAKGFRWSRHDESIFSTCGVRDVKIWNGKVKKQTPTVVAEGSGGGGGGGGGESLMMHSQVFRRKIGGMDWISNRVLNDDEDRPVMMDDENDEEEEDDDDDGDVTVSKCGMTNLVSFCVCGGDGRFEMIKNEA